MVGGLFLFPENFAAANLPANSPAKHPAKCPANSEYENEIEYEDEIENDKEKGTLQFLSASIRAQYIASGISFALRSGCVQRVTPYRGNAFWYAPPSGNAEDGPY